MRARFVSVAFFLVSFQLGFFVRESAAGKIPLDVLDDLNQFFRDAEADLNTKVNASLPSGIQSADVTLTVDGAAVADCRRGIVYTNLRITIKAKTAGGVPIPGRGTTNR